MKKMLLSTVMTQEFFYFISGRIMCSRFFSQDYKVTRISLYWQQGCLYYWKCNFDKKIQNVKNKIVYSQIIYLVKVITHKLQFTGQKEIRDNPRDNLLKSH